MVQWVLQTVADVPPLYIQFVCADRWSVFSPLVRGERANRTVWSPRSGIWGLSGFWADDDDTNDDDPRSQIPDPRSQIPDPRSQIPDPRSQIPWYEIWVSLLIWFEPSFCCSLYETNCNIIEKVVAELNLCDYTCESDNDDSTCRRNICRDAISCGTCRFLVLHESFCIGKGILFVLISTIVTSFKSVFFKATQ